MDEWEQADRRDSGLSRSMSYTYTHHFLPSLAGQGWGIPVIGSKMFESDLILPC